MRYDITISGTIGWETSADYIKYQLAKMKGKRVDVCICSLGGYVTDALDIYQQFRDHGDVHCHFVGMSASAATFLAMGAKSVDMVKNSLILIHNASLYQFNWGSYNKEQLDELIKSLGKDREELATIDKLIATIYADRCGKTVEEVEEKMKVAAWINSTNAKAFGLIDEIRDTVDDDETKAQNIINSMSPTDDTLTELGLPPLPEDYSQEEENPTDKKSLLTMVAQLLRLKKQSPHISNLATADRQPMLKIFATVATLLAVDGFNLNNEDKIELTQEQMKQLDDALKENNEKIKTLNETVTNPQKEQHPEDAKIIADLQAQLKKTQEDLATANEQIENLKKTPGDDTNNAPAATEEEVTGTAFAQIFTK